MHPQKELDAIQKVYDFIIWLSPIVNRLPRDFKFMTGDRLMNHWYDLLELLIEAKYSPKTTRIALLRNANIKLEKIRFIHRLLKDNNMWNLKRHKYIVEQANSVGISIGGWLKAK
ncbi:MAG: diversity-generating retroelement protein Avd [Candidatus Marinimicrobia bacterium]|jgi:hypothetical protein|nr:diversity-generating retroelement protein Avd [Candidatus Neomarinimicrobiota bacterium]